VLCTFITPLYHLINKIKFGPNLSFCAERINTATPKDSKDNTMIHFLLLFLSLFLPALVHGEEVYMMCEREGEIAFTYDQGPSQYTGKLLVTLAKHNIKATFHISPDYLDNPVLLAYLRKASMDGHLIGIFVKESIEEDRIKDYLSNASATIKRYTNYQPQFLRFPSPGPTPDMLKIVTGLGYTVTTYNLDSQDYNAINSPPDGTAVFGIFRDIFDAILPPAKGSFIAIQRDLVQASVEQSDDIIGYALEKGYKPVRLDQCIRKVQAKPADEKDAKKKPADEKSSLKKKPADYASREDERFKADTASTSDNSAHSWAKASSAYTFGIISIVLAVLLIC
jgi:peptidoglycan/xylan/chitin deacetylase (PgdA/CDA1 family)